MKRMIIASYRDDRAIVQGCYYDEDAEEFVAECEASCEYADAPKYIQKCLQNPRVETVFVDGTFTKAPIEFSASKQWTRESINQKLGLN